MFIEATLECIQRAFTTLSGIYNTFWIQSNIRLFADDTIMYLTISNQTDGQDLQADVTKLETWESEWLMAFNPDKCEVIQISNKKTPTLVNYTLHGVSLKETNSAKYLGVSITRDLSWAKHINKITTKSNNSLKFIKRNIQTNNPKLKEATYKTFVRPLVEYAAAVWDPWQKKYIDKIEMTQHMAIRYIFNDYSSTSSVSNMLSKLNLPTLEKRRQISSLTMFYKIKYQLVNIKFPSNIQPSLKSRYSFPHSRINAHRHSFFPRTAKLWNNLSPDICNSPDHGSFRAGLIKLFKQTDNIIISSSFSSQFIPINYLQGPLLIFLTVFTYYPNITAGLPNLRI